MNLPLYRGKGLLSTLSEVQGDPLGVLQRASLLGDVVQLHVPLNYKTIYLINTPELIEAVLISKQKHYGKITRGYHVLRTMLLGNGLVTSDGEFWLKQRRTAQPAFHRDRIKGFGDAMVSLSEACATRWLGQSNIDLHAEMMRLTLRIASMTLLSKDVEGNAASIGGALGEVLGQFMWRTASPFQLPMTVPTPANRRFKAARNTLDSVVNGIIDERLRSKASGTDLLGMLIDSRDPETGEGMGKVQLRDEVMTMFLAGHETTANALAWTFWLLAQHAEVMEKVRAELVSVIGARRATFEDVSKLPFLTMVIKESMRLYPPVWLIARGALDDHQIGDIPIKKGTFVFLSPYLVHRRADQWGDPLAFRPERFGEPSEPKGKHAYIPFIAGPRKCIGDTFAMMEATLVLATLIPRFEFRSLVAHVTPEPVVTLRPKHGLPMEIAPLR